MAPTTRQSHLNNPGSPLSRGIATTRTARRPPAVSTTQHGLSSGTTRPLHGTPSLNSASNAGDDDLSPSDTDGSPPPDSASGFDTPYPNNGSSHGSSPPGSDSGGDFDNPLSDNTPFQRMRGNLWRAFKWAIPKLIVIVVLTLLLRRVFDLLDMPISTPVEFLYFKYYVFFRYVKGDSQAAASRILVDPLGTTHIPLIANSALTVDSLCNEQGPTGLAFTVKQTISRTVLGAQSWEELMNASPESELQELAQYYAHPISKGTALIERAEAAEKRMCRLSVVAMKKGLEYAQTRTLAEKLRGCRQVAQVLQPAKRTLWDHNIIEAIPGDWDYPIVIQAFADLETHLRRQEVIARALSGEAGELQTVYRQLVGNYSVFKYHLRNAHAAVTPLCSKIEARKVKPSELSTWWSKWWFKWVKETDDASSCEVQTREQFLHGGYNISDTARVNIHAAMYYLNEGGNIWENYAKHLDDGIGLLSDVPKVLRDLTAQGITARISRLQYLFDGLAAQLDRAAEILEDAHMRKYPVELTAHVGAQDDESITFNWPPDPIGCDLCDGPREAEWRASIALRFAAPTEKSVASTATTTTTTSLV